MTAALARRVSVLPPLAELAARARRDYGDAYAGGQIGKSMRNVLGAVQSTAVPTSPVRSQRAPRS